MLLLHWSPDKKRNELCSFTRLDHLYMYENMKKYTLSCLSAGHRPGMNVFFVCDSCCHENDIKRLNEALSVTQFSVVQNYT